MPWRSLASLALLVFGCSQAAPPDDSAGGGAGGSPAGGAGAGGQPGDGASYFPLEGTWTYRHLDAVGAGWEETVTSSPTEFMGAAAYKVDENENPAGERGETIHVRRDGKVLRVHQEVFQNGALAFSVDYDPGFLRWDDTWAASAGTMDWSYTRTETDPLGVQNVAERLFHFTVLSTSDQVSVEAGTFDCVHVARVRDDTQETNEYWFAPGVGKVKEVNVTSGGSEELISHQVP